MKKDIFYNYDHPEAIINNMTGVNNDNLIDYSGVHKLLNAKGEELGVVARENSTFSLYFNFKALTDVVLSDILKFDKLHFEILNNQRDVICSDQDKNLITLDLDEFANSLKVTITTSDKGPLKYGVYRLHLYVLDNDTKYTLFSDEAGLLRIE